MNIDQNFKYFKILGVSADQLTLQFSHRQFSNKATIITDILVPENGSVADRDFHW